MQTNERAVTHRSGFTGAPIAVFYEEFSPASGTTLPTVVMVHGGAHSGACYQCTADGRPGWAYRFVERGYPVLVPDWPGIGRSGHVPLDDLTGEIVVRGLSALIDSLQGPVVLLTHSMSGCYGWRLLELHRDKIAAVVGVTPSPPGNIQPEAPVYSDTATTIETVMSGLRVTVDKTKLITRPIDYVERKFIGASRFFPRERLDDYAASLLGVPPGISIGRWNAFGRQVRVSNPSALRGAPVFVVTGTDDLDHSREVDMRIVTWLNEQGARAEFCYLGDRGIVGNGHMLMLEQNSDQVADILLDWIDKARANNFRA